MPAQIGYFDTLKSVAGKVFTYLASITLTGTDGKTITCTQDTSLDEAVAMSSKLAIPGAWTTPAFDAGNFTASGAMTWTVEAADVVTYAYTISGKVMVISFNIAVTTVAGTPSDELHIAIPAGKTSTKTMVNSIYILDNGTRMMGRVAATAGQTHLMCAKMDNSNFAASTNATYLQGQIIFEIN